MMHRHIVWKLGLFTATILATGLSVTADALASDAIWQPVYQDRYDYSKQSPQGVTFNTWFWREDSAATHQFEVTSVPGCSEKQPCVRLTAQAYPANPDYTNAEMYNNSCIQDAKTGTASQQLANLKESRWGTPLFNRITSICNIPYPYQNSGSYLTPYDQNSSWTGTKPAHLDANPLAFTAGDVEAPWKAIRDITFNNPYHADSTHVLRLKTEIKAEAPDQGGSRGWGFWNTSMDPGYLQLAWFMEYSVPEAYLSSVKSDKPNRQVVMQTIGRANDGKTLRICSTVLPAKSYSIYTWRHYSIEWRPDAVRYFVDGHLVADHRNIKLDRHMAFHNWVDNRNYTTPEARVANFPLTQDKTNLIRSFLVEKAPLSALPSLTGKGNGNCQTLSDKNLLRDILKMLAKDYL